MIPLQNRSTWMLLIVVSLPALSGCVSLDLNLARTIANVSSIGSENAVELRKTPKNPLADSLNLIGWGGPKPTERTTQLLRRLDLIEAYEIDAEAVLLDLHQRQIDEPSLEKLHALSELSYIQAKRADALSKEEKAMNLYGSTMVYAYRYLFEPRFARARNSFDPEFRSASDLYNGALEGLLRNIDAQDNLRPGHIQTLNTIGRRIDFAITVNGPWHDEDLGSFEFASDYKVNGLNNTYHTYGLGVPLIAKRQPHENETPEESYYPKGLTFSVTAFFRVIELEDQFHESYGGESDRCVIELHDPMRHTFVTVAGKQVPLESDITTPLAYYLNDPLVSSKTVATLSLLNAEFGKNFRGLYMLEPYDPDRIPVVMVHGLWSSPVTWMEMFNDLRALPEIRDNYQFWFYMYPTGQPFWISAAQMREDLAQAHRVLDPYNEKSTMDQMVLVGHSMGGLVSRMQIMYSEDDFWSIMSDQPFNDLQASQAERDELAKYWFFDPDPSVRRVITLGTPHRGSEFANSTTKWLGRTLFTLPQMLTRSTTRVVRENPGYFENTDLLTITTSVDSLATDSPILPVMNEAIVAPWVSHHNIVGRNPKTNWLSKIGLPAPNAGDGVVSLASASFEDTASQIEVPASHSDIHQHPRAILEVRRVLLEHLARVRSDRTWDPAILPASHQQPVQTGNAGESGFGEAQAPSVEAQETDALNQANTNESNVEDYPSTQVDEIDNRPDSNGSVSIRLNDIDAPAPSPTEGLQNGHGQIENAQINVDQDESGHGGNGQGGNGQGGNGDGGNGQDQATANEVGEGNQSVESNAQQRRHPHEPEYIPSGNTANGPTVDSPRNLLQLEPEFVKKRLDSESPSSDDQNPENDNPEE